MSVGDYGIVVMKFGGSVLTGMAAYELAAEMISAARCREPNERFIVVVSAENGTTDELASLAKTVTEEPEV